VDVALIFPDYDMASWTDSLADQVVSTVSIWTGVTEGNITVITTDNTADSQLSTTIQLTFVSLEAAEAVSQMVIDKGIPFENAFGNGQISSASASLKQVVLSGASSASALYALTFTALVMLLGLYQ
jgi:hypothetical protein